jgi:hypothetical protein
MSYRIVENDVRLLRRILVALHYQDQESADKITAYLRNKGLRFVLPEEQDLQTVMKFIARLYSDEANLALRYGCILLPNYDQNGNNDVIFLNPDFMNPRTMYVRLVHEVPELGNLGRIFWSPDAEHYPNTAIWSVEWLNRIETGRSKSKRPPIQARIKAFVGKLRML